MKAGNKTIILELYFFPPSFHVSKQLIKKGGKQMELEQK
jgi:hypothetical protein